MKLIVNVLNEIVGYLTLFGRLGGRTFNNTNNKYRDLTVNPFHTQIYLSFTIHEFWFFSVHFLRRRSFSLVPVLDTSLYFRVSSVLQLLSLLTFNTYLYVFICHARKQYKRESKGDTIFIPAYHVIGRIRDSQIIRIPDMNCQANLSSAFL